VALLGAASPTLAQSAVQRAAVLDFSVDTGLDPILGRKAADALAVELQRSGDYEIVTRQEIEAAVASQPGLRPPYNEPTQARLAGVVGARTIFSGRVARTVVTDRRSARVQIEVRQLDTATGDYINGTQISEVSEDKLQDFENDVLIDEAINKASFAAVRSMKQTNLPTGTVLNVTANDAELNIGASRGVAVGQRYSVLRDINNRALNRVERVKIGEVTIVNVEADQSTARLSAGGQAGVRPEDKVRQIYVASNFPISPGSGSSSPVTTPVQNRSTGGGFVRKSSQTLLGLLALGGLVAFAGFGGGGSNSPTAPVRSVQAVPIASAPTTVGTVETAGSAIRVNYRDGLPGIVRGEVVGYLIFRGTSPGFATSTGNLIDFVRGAQTTYVDDARVTERREITIEEVNPGGTNTNTPGRLVITETATAAAANELTQDDTTVTIGVTRPPLQAGIQYFYRVARVSATRTTTTNNNTTTINISPIVGEPSSTSGGATAIPTLLLDQTSTSNNLDAFTITLPATLVRGNIDQLTVQVSTASTFPAASTFEQIFTSPAATGTNVVLNLGDIRVRDFEAGESVFVRIGLRATDDVPGSTIFSRPLLLSNPLGNDLIGGRFVSPTGTGSRRGGVGLPGRSGSGGRFNTGRSPGYILRPR
jgi:hypothetical protein